MLVVVTQVDGMVSLPWKIAIALVLWTYVASLLSRDRVATPYIDGHLAPKLVVVNDSTMEAVLEMKITLTAKKNAINAALL